jgi:excisionase family DNA binding protein
MQAVTKFSNEAGRLLSRELSARYIAISTRNLDYLRAAGKIGFVQIGRRVLFSREDLDRFIEARKIL